MLTGDLHVHNARLINGFAPMGGCVHVAGEGGLESTSAPRLTLERVMASACTPPRYSSETSHCHLHVPMLVRPGII